MKFIIFVLCIIAIEQVSEGKKLPLNPIIENNNIFRTFLPSPSCKLTYSGPTLFICAARLDENGNIEKTCSATGPSTSATVTLNSGSKTLQVSQMQLQDLKFSGVCSSCTLQLWSGLSYQGSSYSYSLSKSSNNEIVPSKIWSTSSMSFRVNCAF